MNLSDVYRDNAEDCAFLAERAEDGDVKRALKRMEEAWRTLAQEQEQLDNKRWSTKKAALARRLIYNHLPAVGCLMEPGHHLREARARSGSAEQRRRKVLEGPRQKDWHTYGDSYGLFRRRSGHRSPRLFLAIRISYQIATGSIFVISLSVSELTLFATKPYQ